MPLHTDNKSRLSRLKKLSGAVALALAVPAGAQAASLGKLTVLSSLGQPLRAEIELTSVSKEEEGALVARLASTDAFNKANIDFNPVLSSLRFSVEQRQGKQLIRITSTQPLNDPFVDLLLELSGGGSRLMREYTFLLDPPDMHRPQAAQAAPAAPSAPAPVAPAAAVAAKPVAPAAAVAAKPAEAAPAVKPAPTVASASAKPATPPLDDSDQEPVPTLVTKAAPSSVAEEIMRTGRSEQSGLTNAPVPAAVAEKTAPLPARAEAGNERTGTVKREKVTGKTGDKTYRVKEGDTLAEIAGRTKDNTVSLDQMLIALYRANPDAFIGDNINRLRAGRVLTVPDAATAGAVDKDEARSTVVAQARDFNAYRNKLAGQVASGPSRKADTARQSSGGKVTARVEEKASTGEARDRLQLSKAGTGDRKGAEKASAEEKIAADKAIAEANERVKALEKNVSDLQTLLEIKNKSLAELSAQQKAAGKQAAPVAETKPEANPAETKPANSAPAAEAAKPEAPAAPSAAPAPAPATAEMPKRAITTGPAAKAGFFERIQDNPFVLPGVGALIALLAGWGFVRVRNKKKAAQAAASDSSEEGEPSEEPESKPAAAIVPPEPEQAEEPAAEAEPEAEAMDPIAEADMYISYGRDEQAEDILQLALKTDPDRQAIRSKLLEIYSRRQDVDSFNDVARELHAATGGTGDEWAQAVAMGVVLDPANELYGGVVEPDEPGDLAQEEPAATATESQAQSEPAAPEEEQGLEFDLDDFKAAEVPRDARPVPDIGSKIDFDLELDSGTEADGEEAASVPANLPKRAEPASPIDLDLPAPAEPPKPVDVLEDDESAFAAEMSTKLDLAAAYQEIGDKEGARELLEEVMRGGSDTQIERAKDMLSRLS